MDPLFPDSPRRRRGMTLVEVMVALVIMTVSVYLLTSTITATIAHTRGKQERATAVDAVMNLFEHMRSEPFEELFTLYNIDDSDDPSGPGSAPGANFAVPGLDPDPADGDGFVGEIILPSQGPQLREDVTQTKLGMPRDLNGDLRADARDHANDYIVLPVTVRLRWRGAAGSRKFEMSTMFANITKL
ncbi:MAG: prepilin-type N-terminal cleavage/methylation domain-containing protein [bacterium]|nr:prepilin-type N-terminal cleavage/methylation domain-containing protein [bacterium]